jgi:hypothetical protein
MLAASMLVYGQRLSIGLAGGGSLTDSFPTLTTPADFGIPGSPTGIRTFSSSKDWIVGPTIEFHFTSQWSVEADGLYRKLHFVEAAVLPNGSLNSVSPSPVVTWEFPVLAKYRFGSSRARPFLEAGPSFRTAGNLNGTRPSHAGITAGAGVEVRSHFVAIAPELRYTRWAGDNILPGIPASNVNQLELLVGLSRSSESDSRPLGRHFSAGVIVGTALTDEVGPQSFSFLNGTSTFTQTSTPKKTVIAGVMIEIPLPKRFSFETDALYRPSRTHAVNTLDGKQSEFDSNGNSVWELPQLAKYRFATGRLRPFVEGGPSFRLPWGGDLSNHGATAGGGIETKLHALKIAPMVRYTRWANPRFPDASRQNQVEVLAGFAF